MKLILASASPRRRYLMGKGGYRFAIHVSHVSERASPGLTPPTLVSALALKKARAVARKFPNDVVLGADTLVFINGHTVGKPKNPLHAKRMLRELSGRWQRVYTGVAVVWDGGRRKVKSSAVSYVKFRKLSEQEIDRASRKHLDKAGGYAVQEKGDGFVAEIRGDYDNVVGLPMKLVKRLLRRCGQTLSKRVGHHVHFQR